MSTYFYKAFGLILKSINLELPELEKTDFNNNVDLIIREEDSNNWPNIKENINATPFLNFAEDDLRLDIEGICKIRVYDRKIIAWEKFDKTIDKNEIRVFLLGSAIGALLIQKNFLVLHGCSLEKEGKSIVCLGISGSGKSTLAYALMEAGWNILADDIVAINSNGNVLPGIPRVKLWLDAINQFDLEQKKLLRVRKNLNKYSLFGNDIKKCFQETPLEAIYFIKNRNVDKTPNQKIFEAINSKKLSLLLIRNLSFRPRFIKGLNKEALNFLKIIEIIKKTRLYSLYLPSKIEDLRQICRRDIFLTNSFH